jgi:hypothetical protein
MFGAADPPDTVVPDALPGGVVLRAGRAGEAQPLGQNGQEIARASSQLQQELPAALVSRFTLKVQPVLMRSCATAGCHDSNHSGPLVLQRSAKPNARTTQQNLRATLAVLNSLAPDSSPLLTQALVCPHPTDRRLSFALQSRDPAYQTLAAWVRSVAAQTNPPARAKQAAKKPSDARPAAEAENANSASGTAAEPPSSTAPPPARHGYQPVDPFDPEIFNRRFHSLPTQPRP